MIVWYTFLDESTDQMDTYPPLGEKIRIDPDSPREAFIGERNITTAVDALAMLGHELHALSAAADKFLEEPLETVVDDLFLGGKFNGKSFKEMAELTMSALKLSPLLSEFSGASSALKEMLTVIVIKYLKDSQAFFRGMKESTAICENVDCFRELIALKIEGLRQAAVVETTKGVVMTASALLKAGANDGEYPAEDSTQEQLSS